MADGFGVDRAAQVETAQQRTAVAGQAGQKATDPASLLDQPGLLP